MNESSSCIFWCSLIRSIFSDTIFFITSLDIKIADLLDWYRRHIESTISTFFWPLITIEIVNVCRVVNVNLSKRVFISSDSDIGLCYSSDVYYFMPGWAIRIRPIRDNIYFSCSEVILNLVYWNKSHGVAHIIGVSYFSFLRWRDDWVESWSLFTFIRCLDKCRGSSRVRCLNYSWEGRIVGSKFICFICFSDKVSILISELNSSSISWVSVEDC